MFIEQLAKGEQRMKKIYTIQNLGCANCAAKIERKIESLPGVKSATITFATKKLTLEAFDHSALLEEVNAIIASIEHDACLLVSDQPAKKSWFAEKKDEIQLLAGAFLFILGFVISPLGDLPSMLVFLMAYLILGFEIVLYAIRNIIKGNVFDENFLMSIATIGAIVIGMYSEAVGVMLFYRVGEWFEEKAVEKNRKQIMDAVDLRPETVLLVDHGHTHEISASKAEVGNIILVRPGDRIPLDGHIVDGSSRIDTSPVTGESVPISVSVGSEVISGCINTSGAIKIAVDKPLSESMVSRILESVENAAANKPSIDRFITRFSRIYTPFVVAVSIATAIIPSLITGNWSHWIYTALTFLVISCPCALVLSVPLAFFSGIGAGSKMGILFKGGSSIEALTKVKAIVLDKTGTITKGNFILHDITPEKGFDTNQLLQIAATCESASTHPIASSIRSAAFEIDLPKLHVQETEEVSGHGIRCKIDDSTYLCGKSELLINNGVDLSNYQSSDYGTEVLLSKDGVFLGSLNISDTLKEDAVEAISDLNAKGYYTAMLTGDSEKSAAYIGRKVQLKEIFSKLLPLDKLNMLNNIREKQGPVLFVGDGINDAPVLAAADVGAAMGSGSDAAIEAADVVYMTSHVEAIPASIQIAKNTNHIAMQNVIFALLIKGLIMALGFAGIASMWLAVFADTGVALLCILNSVRILYKKF